jgi:outer membrane protein TolC
VLKPSFLLLFASGALFAEVHPLTLRQAIDLALQQNPDVALARLDEQKAQAAVRIAKDPFTPKVWAGSGLAKTFGYPSSIEGAAPSIVQTRTDMALFNRSKTYDLARARENSRGAGIATLAKGDDVAYQTALLFLDTDQLAKSQGSLNLEVDSLSRVADTVKLRVQEGRELPIANMRAALDVAHARQRLDSLKEDLDYGEASLAVVLGFPPADRVQPVQSEPPRLDVPDSEPAAVELALQNNKDVKRLESQLQAKGLEINSYRAMRLPVVDVVAQYALFAKSNYDQFFTHFQRNNGEIGAAISIPLLVGSASKGYVSQAESEALALRTQISQTRSRIDLDIQKSYHELEKAGEGHDVARLDLDYAREQVSVILAQMEEGRATQQAVDDARLAEQEKWIVFYDTQHTLEKARLEVLRQTGTLTAALRQ